MVKQRSREGENQTGGKMLMLTLVGGIKRGGKCEGDATQQGKQKFALEASCRSCTNGEFAGGYSQCTHSLFIRFVGVGREGGRVIAARLGERERAMMARLGERGKRGREREREYGMGKLVLEASCGLCTNEEAARDYLQCTRSYSSGLLELEREGGRAAPTGSREGGREGERERAAIAPGERWEGGREGRKERETNDDNLL